MDKRKNALQKEAKLKSSKTNTDIFSEYHQDKGGYPRIRRKEKCAATQLAQDRPRIFQHQVILNDGSAKLMHGSA
jgi:hypothetical protein